MKWGLYLSAAVLVGVCATWAYRVNYATQEAVNRVADLHGRINAEREALSVLHAEWAYLNRPDRLAALIKGPGSSLGLVPLTPEQFGEAAMVPFPPEPELTVEATPPAAGAPPVVLGSEGPKHPVTGPLARITSAGAKP
jgi:hypothetical protein